MSDSFKRNRTIKSVEKLKNLTRPLADVVCHFRLAIKQIKQGKDDLKSSKETAAGTFKD